MPREIRVKRLPGFVYQAINPRRKKMDENEEEAGREMAEKSKDKNDVIDLKVQEDQNPQKIISLRKFAKPRRTKSSSPPPKSPTIPTTQSPKSTNSQIRRHTSLPNDPTQNSENLDSLLDKLYKFKENPSAYSAQIQKYIDQNYSLSLHKQRRKKFLRRPFLVYDPMEAIQADLIFFNSPEIVRANSFYKYILSVIDIFSKKAFVRPLKTKNSTEVAKALDDIISQFPITPRKLMVDNGTEFSGSSNAINDVIVQKYRMVIYILTDSQHKAGIVERFNRTLKQRIARFMTENNTKRYIDSLQDIVDNYNQTFHRAIGMAPNSVSFTNRAEVFKHLFPKSEVKVKCKIQKGWRVRIPREKSIFEKGYTPIWTKEIFIVDKIEQVCLPFFCVSQLFDI